MKLRRSFETHCSRKGKPLDFSKIRKAQLQNLKTLAQLFQVAIYTFTAVVTYTKTVPDHFLK